MAASLTPHPSHRYWGAPLGPRKPRQVPDIPEGASAPTHSHRLPRIVAGCLAGLIAVNVLVLTGLALLATFVYQDHEYVQGRGEYRDQETDRLEEEIRQGKCDLLDGLPADSRVLDRLRQENGCGPGIPRDQLPPEVRQQLDARWLQPSVDGPTDRLQAPEPPPTRE
jgi:hypothetical protein